MDIFSSTGSFGFFFSSLFGSSHLHYQHHGDSLPVIFPFISIHLLSVHPCRDFFFFLSCSRDGELFSHILRWLRDGYVLLHPTQYQAVQQEATVLGLHSLARWVDQKSALRETQLQDVQLHDMHAFVQGIAGFLDIKPLPVRCSQCLSRVRK